MLARLEAFDRHILRSNHKDADVTIEAGLGRSWIHCRIFRSYHPYPLLLAFEIYYTKKRFEHKPEVVVLVFFVLIHVFRLQEHCLRRANHPGIVGKLSRLSRSLRTALWQKRRMISCSIASRLVHSGSHASPCLNILLWCFHDASSMIHAVQCCSRTWFPQIWSKHLPFVATTWFFSNVVSAHFPRWSCMHLFETRYLQHF